MFADRPNPPDVFAAIIRNPLVVEPTVSLMDAIGLMNAMAGSDAERASCVVVVQAESVVGIVSERDIVRFSSNSQPLDQLTVQAVMVSPIVTLPESQLTDWGVAMRLLQQQRIRHLPLVDEHDRLVGLLTDESLCKAQLQAESAVGQTTENHLWQSEQRYAALVAASPVGILHTDVNGICIYANERYCEILGVKPIDLIGQFWSYGYDPEDLERINQAFEQAQREQRSIQVEYRIRRPDNSETWVFGQAVANYDLTGQLIGYVGTMTDISDRKRTEFLLERQQHVLERIAQGDVLHDVLTELLHNTEFYLPGTCCSILLCDAGRLWWTAAPSLPQAYCEAVNGAPIAEGVGSCGTAAFRGEVVVVSDIATDPLWQNYKDLALGYDLKACWSAPILSSDGGILGVFGIYYRTPQIPQAEDLERLRQFANIAGIAIEREQATRKLKQLNQELERRVQERTQALQEREQFLQTVLDTFPLSIFWKDRNSVYLGGNRNFLRDANLTNITEIIGKTDDDLPWGDADAATCRQIDQEVMREATAKLGIVECQYQADGTEVWTEMNQLPLRNFCGDVVGVLGTYQDISDRKRIEAALAESEAKFRRLVEGGQDVVWAVDGESRFTYLSPQFKTLFGWEPQDWIGQSALGIAHPDDRDWLTQEMLSLQNQTSTQTHVEYRGLHQNQPYIWLRASLTSILDANGAFVGCQGNLTDISSLKNAELALKDSERRYATLTDTAPVAIFQYDQDGNTIYVNDHWSAMTGRPKASALGFGWLEAVHPDEREEVIAGWTLLRQQIAVAPPGEPVVCRREGRHLCPDGRINWFDIQIVREFDSAGNIIGYVGTLTDITDRKQAEAQLKQTNEELLRATRLKDEFLANMSHELRTPLNAILGTVEILEEQIFGSLNDRQLKALKAIERSSNHLLELITDILDVAKIEAGQTELTYVTTDIRKLCESSLAFIKQQALNKRIQLEIVLPDHLPAVYLDERRIRQVLINLLNNAVKFTSNGGLITLQVAYDRPPAASVETLSASNPSIQPGDVQQPGYAWDCDTLSISVSDTGIGISPENINHLFQPFSQIDSALNRQYNGSGLGLALVKRLAELHGGQVSLTSEVDIGSCFTIALPARPPEDAVSQETDITSTTPPIMNLAVDPDTQPLVLLVEDNESNVTTISDYLSAKGFRITVASNGQMAIDSVQAQQPDVILMDIQMPGMDGLEAIQRIRQYANCTEIPIIALTALAMPGDRERCLAIGASDYLSKPVILKQLVATIQTWL